jgi:hypothetical protein
METRIFYSKTSNGFFHEEIMAVENMPTDVVEVAEADYKSIIAEMAETGRVLAGDEEGHPQAVEQTFTDEELAEAVRRERDGLVKDSDWTQLPDIPDSVRAAWSIYRQELRDVPQQQGFPRDVQWPVKPSPDNS